MAWPLATPCLSAFSLRPGAWEQMSERGRIVPIRLAIIDGHTLIRYGLSKLAAQHSDIEIVAEWRSAADARRMIAAVQPDVVTVEVGLPDGDGLRLAREFRDRHAGL